MGVEYAGDCPASRDFFQPAVWTPENTRCPYAVEFEIVPDIKIRGSKVSLPVKRIDALVEVSMKIPGLVVFRFGKRVLAVNWERVRKSML